MRTINEQRLMERLNALGATGIGPDGARTRLAASDEDKAGRDLVARWMREAGLTVVVDRIGNLFGIWKKRFLRKFLTIVHGDTAESHMRQHRHQLLSDMPTAEDVHTTSAAHLFNVVGGAVQLSEQRLALQVRSEGFRHFSAGKAMAAVV